MSQMTRGRFDGWGLYLTAIVCLIPVVVPSGPARLAIVDAVIALGMIAFVFTILGQRENVRVPFLVPVVIITVGSLAAVVNAVSPTASFLALAQDAYLFLWFVMLVHLLRDRDLTRIQLTWVWAGNIIALIALFILFKDGDLSLADFIKPRGRRALGTFYDPNMFAGYLVMSMFFVLSLGRKLPRLAKWGSLALLSVCIIATKSNGGALSLVAGLAAWGLMRAWTMRIPIPAIVAGTMLIVALAVGVVWMIAGFGLGASQLNAFESNSFLARASHSSAGRFTIWKNLQATYAKSPLGIGPGNSRYLTLTVEQRLRPNSLQAKEAHNDYLAYAIERGPLGLLGLLAMLGLTFAKLGAAARRREDEDSAADPTGPLVAAATGAMVATAVHALTIEVLHFRHVWMLLAIVCAIEAQAKRARAERGGEAGSASMWSAQRPGVEAA